MGKFFLFLFLSAFLIAATTFFAINEEVFHEPSFFTETLVLLIFSTGLLFIYLFKTDKPGFFIQLYLLSMTVKLLAYCAYCLLMILKDRAGAFSNVVFFLICYSIFTVIEIGFLYRKINRKSTPLRKG